MKFLILFCFAVCSLQWVLATIEVMQQPGSSFVADGQNHTLTCIFNQPVNCKWQRNGIPTDIKDRYLFISDDGTNTTDCSIQITNITVLYDIHTWVCQGNDLMDPNTHAISNPADLYSNVQPNRTAIMLNGIPVTEIWVPKNGSQNGTLSCVAENALPKANLNWNVFKNKTAGLKNLQNNNTEPDCSQMPRCNSTIHWLGDSWKELLNYTNLMCIVRQGNDFEIKLSATLRFVNDNNGAQSAKLHFGTIAGAVLAMIVLMLWTRF